MIDGYTEEELSWVQNCRTERQKAFAPLCVELSRKFKISRTEVWLLVQDNLWSTWDTSAYVENYVKNNFPLRGEYSETKVNTRRD